MISINLAHKKNKIDNYIITYSYMYALKRLTRSKENKQNEEKPKACLVHDYCLLQSSPRFIILLMNKLVLGTRIYL